MTAAVTVLTSLLGIIGTIAGVWIGSNRQRDQWLRDQRLQLYAEVIDWGDAVLEVLQSSFGDATDRQIPQYPQLRSRILLLAPAGVQDSARWVLGLRRFIDDPFWADQLSPQDVDKGMSDHNKLIEACQRAMRIK